MWLNGHVTVRSVDQLIGSMLSVKKLSHISALNVDFTNSNSIVATIYQLANQTVAIAAWLDRAQSNFKGSTFPFKWFSGLVIILSTPSLYASPRTLEVGLGN